MAAQKSLLKKKSVVKSGDPPKNNTYTHTSRIWLAENGGAGGATDDDLRVTALNKSPNESLFPEEISSTFGSGTTTWGLLRKELSRNFVLISRCARELKKRRVPHIKRMCCGQRKASRSWWASTSPPVEGGAPFKTEESAL